MEPVYREIKEEEIGFSLFEHFDRSQQVTKCWRRTDGIWTVRNIEFTDDWRRHFPAHFAAENKRKKRRFCIRCFYKRTAKRLCQRRSWFFRNRLQIS